jgi:hypothetical protein
MKMLAKHSGMILSLLAAGLLASCTTASIKETWRSPEAHEAPYRKLLVIGITQQPNLRQSFENIFSETLRQHGVTAVRSYTLLDDLSKANQAQIQALAKQVGADAVVVTRVVSRSEHTSYHLATGSLQQQTVVMYESGPTSSTAIAMSAVGIVPGEMDSLVAFLETRFFDAASANLIWSALVRVAGPDNEKINVCWKISALLVKALGKDQMIELNGAKFR